MRFLLALLLVVMSAAARADDMQQYLQDTQAMIQAGQHKEALERCLWFHEHAVEHDPGMSAVRLSFALSYWQNLGKVYPPARVAMIEVRDNVTKQVAAHPEKFALFQEAAALNRTLDENAKTVELFQLLDQTHPDSARLDWIVAKDAVIAAKRYDLAKKYIGTPLEAFNRIKEMYDYNVKLYDNPQLKKADLKKYNDNRLVTESLQLIEVLLALGDPKGAAETQAKALAIHDDVRLRAAIPVAPQ